MPITKPKRIQRQRVKGWRTPAKTIIVTRPTIFGNPFVGPEAVSAYARFLRRVITCQIPGDRGGYERMLAADEHDVTIEFERPIDRWHELRSKLTCDPCDLTGANLACYCSPDRPCHADVLLEAVNQPDIFAWADMSGIDG